MKPQQPDQFSQEYISFILSDEAEWLQEKWEPGFGDTVLYACVQHTLTSAKPCEILRGPRAGFRQVDIGLLTWLPTLYDLLQIIEGAGWRWELEMTKRGRAFNEYTIEAERETTPESLLVIDRWEEDLLLAAAKLAVRAIKS